MSDSSAHEHPDDDEEPSLRYSDYPHYADLLVNESASALALSSRFIAIATHNGSVITADYNGKLIKKWRTHAAAINDISIDQAGEYIATASLDGKVAVLSTTTAEIEIHDLGRPMRCISLEPTFSRKSTRHFVSGGMAGALTLHEKGWLGHKQSTIHSDDGPIWAASWCENLIAWASDKGVRIYDFNAGTKITFIARPQDAPRADLYKCSLQWKDEKTLIIAWADLIKVAKIREKDQVSKHHTVVANANAAYTTVVGHQPQLYAQIETALQLDCMISGVVAWKNSFAVLAYVTESSDDDSQSSRDPYAQPEPEKPELRIVSSDGEELSMDVLSIPKYSRYQCFNYTLASVPGKDTLVVVSPKDIIVANPWSKIDHVHWLLERERYREALECVEEHKLHGEDGIDLPDIGQKYLHRLMAHEEYQEAANECRHVLGVNAQAWEKWIFLFLDRGQIELIIPHVPTQDPTLSRLVYELILAHLLKNDPPAFITTIRKWRTEMYDINAVIIAVQDALDRQRTSVILMEALSELYNLNRQFADALPLLLKLRRPDVFDFIREHNLFTEIRDQVKLLIEFDADMRRRLLKSPTPSMLSPGTEHRPAFITHTSTEPPKVSRHGAAVDMLVDHTHSIPMVSVVQQLKDNRQYLYMYLDALFDRDPHLATDYSDQQVELYVEYDPARLMEFFRASNAYNLQDAYQVCQKADLVPEMVFLLGRMGNNKEALNLIIERLNDVQRAIDFAKHQNDNDLWEDLLRYSETRPNFIRALLENVGPEIDPLRLIKRIKDGLEIPGLKQALLKILQDYTLQISLMEGCQTILYSDCRSLMMRLHTGQSGALICTPDSTCHTCSLPLQSPTETLSILYLCGHRYHSTCAFGDIDFLPAAKPTALGVTESSLSQKFTVTRLLKVNIENRSCKTCSKSVTSS